MTAVNEPVGIGAANLTDNVQQDQEGIQDTVQCRIL
jgi:hypothetical protein